MTRQTWRDQKWLLALVVLLGLNTLVVWGILLVLAWPMPEFALANPVASTNTPTNTPTSPPTATPTLATATLTATPSPTATDTPTATPTPTAAPTDTPTATPTAPPTFTPTITPTDRPTNTPTSAPTDTPTGTPVPPTATPTTTPSVTATATPANTPTPTETATKTSTVTATSVPTDTPTVTPTTTTTNTPAATPTDQPTNQPTFPSALAGWLEQFRDWLASLWSLGTPATTPAATSSSTLTPTPTWNVKPGIPTAAITATLSILNHDYFLDDVGDLYIVGEVRNDGPANVRKAQITATLYIAEGRVITQVRASALMNLLVPGQRVPFVIPCGRQTAFHHYDLAAGGQVTLLAPAQGLAIVSVSHYVDRLNFFTVTGEVSNFGQERRTYVKVVVTLYDDTGIVVNAGYAYTNPPHLETGQRASFHFAFRHYPWGQRYELQVEKE